jgi:coenzyme PQQ biosynthesis probable peptidase PqqF
MPDASAPASESFVLDNGLQVRLNHEPRLKRAAAFLRIAAGSHDVPVQWPGLAHFLEHLFFLGTERFHGDQGLMSFVQRHGGQVNASTRERHTDFFFELPPAAFGGALERLCEMLAHPRMSQAEQLREREVLHAEFIAWSRDPQAKHELWLTSALAANHPLRAFHAGNRYSLPVPRDSFQQDLRDFYRRYYQAGQMTLCLTGPQTLEELRTYAEQAAAHLAPGSHAAQPPAPALVDGAAEILPTPDASRLNLLFALEQLPPAAEQALDFLGTWLSASQAGGLLAELRRRGLVQSLHLNTFYRFGEQALVDIDFKLTSAGQASHGLVAALCFDWLEFFQAHDDWYSLREEYVLLRKRRLEVSSALDLARQACDQFDCELPADGLHALRNLLERLRPEQLLHPLPAAEPGEVAARWRLPQRNRFLRPSRRPDHSIDTPHAMQYLPATSPQGHDGALHLRWRLNAGRHPGLFRMLEDSMRKLAEEARQAGVVVTFNHLGEDWQLAFSGVPGPMPALLEQALEMLASPAPEVWRQTGQGNAEPVLAPIRELLKRLPEHSLGQFQNRISDEDLRPLALQKLWASARWDGLAMGLDEADCNALNGVLRKMPGTPCTTLATLPTTLQGKVWSEVACPSSEHALLLFCPPAAIGIADEAAWRMLAHLCQTPFYKRLRVDLQLGYAVFSGLRQIAGRPGLVFGVQSPSASLADVLAHIESFIDELPALIGALDLSTLDAQARELASQVLIDDMAAAQAAQLLWQARQAGHSTDYPNQLYRALLVLQPGDLLAAAQQLREAAGGWLCLANGPVPDASWRRAG